ncbi:MAG: STAS domain-containing protein [Deferribacteraceae bacterium]|jgi:anti-sigma B factor antagonist|nr:STAS domain-containing protein [Deferribacteraceae bacterium]
MALNRERNTHGDLIYEIIYPLHEIDSFKGEEIKNHIASVIEEVGALIIDFSKIAYLNSSGLREMIQILKLTREHGKKLILAQLSQDMKRVFVHTNLDRLFTFEDTLQAAINKAADVEDAQ